MEEQSLYPTNFNKQQYSQIEDQVPTQENMPPSIQRHQIQNPFSAEQYGNINLPDSPLNYGGGIVEALLGDKNVPDQVKKPFWWVFLNDTTLSFADEEKKMALMMNFDIIKIDVLNSIPFYDYTFEAERTWNVLRNVFETKVNRSVGFKGNAKNERILLQSQFTEQRNIMENNQGNVQQGFLKRLLGRK